jgi:ubiquinone/menaquinone biosynthesis C-methylase UbiE
MSKSRLKYSGYDHINRILAPESEALAEKHCSGSYVNKSDCKWYHQSWLYLKQVQLVSHPTWQQDFYYEKISYELSNFTGNKFRILISGAADFEMFALVESIKNVFNDISCEIFLLDMCLTPLLITRKYAEINGGTPRLINGNVLWLPFDNRIFNIIISDAFLTRFPNGVKEHVISEWKRVLKKNGSIITTIRLEPNLPKNTTFIASLNQRIVYITKTIFRSFKRGLSTFKLARYAKNYSKKIMSYPFSDIAEITSLFNELKLDISTKKTTGEMKETLYANIHAKYN